MTFWVNMSACGMLISSLVRLASVSRAEGRAGRQRGAWALRFGEVGVSVVVPLRVALA